MTREYGNYEKYESGRNRITEEIEKGEDDTGLDRLFKNEHEMIKRMSTMEGESAREEEDQAVENLLTNDQYADQTIKDRMMSFKFA